MARQTRPPEDNALARGSSGAMADAAVSGRPSKQDSSPDAPAARPAPPLPEDKSFDQLAEKVEQIARKPGG